MKAKILLLSATLILEGVTALAQVPLPPPAPLPPEHDPVGENLFPPELIMQNQRAIGLEEAQKTYMRSEISKAQGHFTELQWQLQDAMETLASLLKQDTVEEQKALGQLDQVLNFEREIKRAQMGLMVRIKNKLTPEQQARLHQLRPIPPGE